MTTLDGPRERSSVLTSSLERNIGLTGIVGTVLLFVALIAGSPGEPPTDATTADAAKYLADMPGWVAPVEALTDIAMMVVLWSMVGLALILRRYEGATPVRSTVAMLSATLFLGWAILDASQEAGAHRAADLDQGQLAYAYDLTAIGLTNIWLPMGTFAFACGWVIVSTKAMPRWLGGWGVIGGIGLSLAQVHLEDRGLVCAVHPGLAVAGHDLGAAGSPAARRWSPPQREEHGMRIGPDS